MASSNASAIASEPGGKVAAGNQASYVDEQFSSRFIFGVAIFLSAFLLFQVQLLLGKFLLPWFGGGSAVWATCMLFFQCALLGGYGYAHALAARWSFRRQGVVHLAALAASVALLALATYHWGSPLLPDARWKPAAGAAPIAGILLLLSISIGVPFLLLASTTPLLQRWFAHIHAGAASGGEPPYYLYALSNTGSLLGLLTYPAFFERAYTLRAQAGLWTAFFGFFVLCCASCAWKAVRSSGSPAKETQTPRAPVSLARRLMWFGLAACGSLLMLSTTNRLTQDIAPVPLLWVLPLSVYLATFVVVFQSARWYRREIFHPLLALALIIASMALFRTDMSVFSQVSALLFALFATCMVCHGELARMKPETGHLTAFYLILSAGGAGGGIFVVLIAPAIFAGLWEYHLALWLCAALLAVVLLLEKNSWFHESKPWLPLALLAAIAAAPRYLASVHVFSLPHTAAAIYTAALLAVVAVAMWLGLSGGPAWLRRREFHWNEVTVAGGLCMLSLTLLWNIATPDGTLLERSRNFYGSLAVREQRTGKTHLHYIELMHGRITHGLQLQGAGQSAIPAAYYNATSGAGLALQFHPRRAQGAMRVGAVGMGVGTLAAYARPGDVFRFYEINPAVIRIAQGKRFTFLKDSSAVVEIVPGDARLSLEAEAQRGEMGKFDVLVVDAFNGDAIPVHLLTVEAMETYLKHMRGPESIIAFHVSNIAVNLEPVVAGLAQRFNMNAALITSVEKDEAMLQSDWALLSRGSSLQTPEIARAGLPMMKLRKGLDAEIPAPVWTDGQSNLLGLLRR